MLHLPGVLSFAITFVWDTFGLGCKSLAWNLRKCLQSVFEHMCMVSVENALEQNQGEFKGAAPRSMALNS